MSATTLRLADLPLAKVSARAPEWATSTRTTLDSAGPAEVVVNFESRPEVVPFGLPGQVVEVSVSAVATDWYSMAGDLATVTRDVLVRVDDDLITVEQARTLAAALLAAAELAATAGGVL
jgi:hypothetical protein